MWPAGTGAAAGGGACGAARRGRGALGRRAALGGVGGRCDHRGRSSFARKKKRSNRFLCNQWQWWVISPKFTKLSLVEHPLRRSTKMVNPAFRSTILVNSDLVDLECLENF